MFHVLEHRLGGGILAVLVTDVIARGFVLMQAAKKKRVYMFYQHVRMISSILQ